MSKRPSGLIAIVAYKTFTATIFAIASGSIFLAIGNHEGLQEFAESLVLAGKKGIVAWLLEKVLNVNFCLLALPQLFTQSSLQLKLWVYGLNENGLDG